MTKGENERASGVLYRCALFGMIINCAQNDILLNVFMMMLLPPQHSLGLGLRFFSLSFLCFTLRFDCVVRCGNSGAAGALLKCSIDEMRMQRYRQCDVLSRAKYNSSAQNEYHGLSLPLLPYCRGV